MQQASVVEEQSTETFDLVKYLLLFWHWLWVILLALIIAIIGAYYVSKMIRPVYQAKTTVLVDMASSNSANSDYGFVLLNSQLTQTYSQMITKAPILTEVATNLGIAPIDPKSVSAKPIINTQLISLTVNSTDPQKAHSCATPSNG
jgi:non-specific protein-tyrosine kinase